MDMPFWQAASPWLKAMWGFPLPLWARAITFSRRSIHLQLT
jgi:hypothetical protein